MIELVCYDCIAEMFRFIRIPCPLRSPFAHA